MTSRGKIRGLERKLQLLTTVGEVGIYTTIDGGFGVSLDFHDKSYYLAYPADTIQEAADNLIKDWRMPFQAKKKAKLTKMLSDLTKQEVEK